MIPSTILHPFLGPHPALMSARAVPPRALEQPAGVAVASFAAPAVFAVGADPAASQPAAGIPAPAAGAHSSEHERLTAGTADMWRQLVHLCWETP